jgi:hypothetical protein
VLQLGLSVGDYLEVTTDGRRVVLTPKQVMIVDRK